ncbi:aromatic-ring-hydroxylating dioxygenase subunit beta [Arthrobacter sp. efr-133-TYG-118]|uniref:aromatic-ring-hydroxylating dioxygenase subunit beta n=1 Tax=Arthrobacter sp. efr-133-TYG-118 TaxID=3040279 RepID=UPI00254CB271|nr:aromatic-ring-hydroxylating dioxygenase subunit beta [Arthrobacter sp. efr-133-TYG-118]
MTTVDQPTPVLSAFRNTDLQTQHTVEQFLYAEAELLDDYRFDEWIDLFTDDVTYWIPNRETRPIRERHLEVAAQDEAAIILDDKFFLKGRVRRITSGISWSEEPPSRARRLITNIRVQPAAKPGELDVRSNFYVYRSRLERHQDWFVGQRFDVLRPADPASGYPFQIANRKIVLEQTTILAPSLTTFL